MIPWSEYMAKIRQQQLEDIGIMPKYTSTGRTGDIVKCVNNHGLYTLLGDVVPGAVIESDMFEVIGDAPVPEYGGKIAPCHVCGLPWVIKGPNGGWVLCNVQRKFEA
jgi:hypothetical protein